jgi:hypothetical protein
MDDSPLSCVGTLEQYHNTCRSPSSRLFSLSSQISMARAMLLILYSLSCTFFSDPLPFFCTCRWMRLFLSFFSSAIAMTSGHQTPPVLRNALGSFKPFCSPPLLHVLNAHSNFGRLLERKVVTLGFNTLFVNKLFVAIRRPSPFLFIL